MSALSIFNIAGSGMTAQSVRMNTIASNIANAQTIARTEQDAYKAKFPVFVAKAMRDSFSMRRADDFSAGGALGSDSVVSGVSVSEIIESDAPVEKRHMPDHPYADEDGYVFVSNVNTVEEMADMISASRAFQMNVELANTAKSMTQRLITLGQ